MVEQPGDTPVAPEAPVAPEVVEQPGDAPVAPEAPVAPDLVEQPGDAPVAPEAPIAPEVVEEPGDTPIAPIAPNAPKGPTLLERLNPAEHLKSLMEKIIIEIPTQPVPDVEPTNGDLPIPDYGPVTILDEEVPLANAPKTGDISGLWAALSFLSMGGMGLLNKKRKK